MTGTGTKMQKLGIGLAAFAIAVCVTPRAQDKGEMLAFASAPREEARDFVGLLSNWNFGSAMNELSDGFRRQMSHERLQAAWEPLVRKYGPCLARDVTSVELDGQRWAIHVLCTFRSAYVDAVIYFDTLASDKKVTGFRFAKVSREQPVG